MKIETVKQLRVKLKGDDIDHFKSALTKISKEQKKVGYSASLLNDDEVKVIENIIEKLKP